eukprot:5722491-Amphidinium_carterae.1
MVHHPSSVRHQSSVKAISWLLLSIKQSESLSVFITAKRDPTINQELAQSFILASASGESAAFALTETEDLPPPLPNPK